MLLNPDLTWQALAKTDPYWAVLTADEFRRDRMGEAALKRFFDSGQEYVDWVFSECESHIVSQIRPQRALDFGCGVGRIALPLALRCNYVCAVDVAPAMIEHGRRHAREQGIANIDWHAGRFSTVPCKTYDFVHSFIVLQHIPVTTGVAVIGEMLDRLDTGGVGVIHVTYMKPAQHHEGSRRFLAGVRDFVGGVYDAIRARCVPQMQMNPYPLNVICGLLQEHGVRRLHAHFTDHGTRGVVLMFQKTPGDAYPRVLHGHT